MRPCYPAGIESLRHNPSITKRTSLSVFRERLVWSQNAAAKFWCVFEPAKSWQRQRTVARAFTTEQVSRAWLFAEMRSNEAGDWVLWNNKSERVQLVPTCLRTTKRCVGRGRKRKKVRFLKIYKKRHFIFRAITYDPFSRTSGFVE